MHGRHGRRGGYGAVGGELKMKVVMIAVRETLEHSVRIHQVHLACHGAALIDEGAPFRG